MSNDPLLRRRDAIARKGRSLVARRSVFQCLSTVGEVHRVGSFWLRLAIRPEIDFLLLVDDDPQREVPKIAGLLEACLPGAAIEIERRASGSHAKWFVRAVYGDLSLSHTMPFNAWTIDVATWRRDLWFDRFTAPEKHVANLRRKLTPEKIRAVLHIKEAIRVSPEAFRGAQSSHVYEAVLEYGIADSTGFSTFLSERAEPR